MGASRKKNNHKKIFPSCGLEEDCTSRWGRRYLCYVSNTRGIRSFVKNKMNRRMRKVSKDLIREETRFQLYEDRPDSVRVAAFIMAEAQQSNNRQVRVS